MSEVLGQASASGVGTGRATSVKSCYTVDDSNDMVRIIYEL
ncbi:unnamed protein product, partial [marine sediment metagenome]